MHAPTVERGPVTTFRREHVMDDPETFARQVLAAQPFSRFLGARLVAVGPRSAELSLPVAPHHEQQHGFVHGGVISYLADNAITFAGGLAFRGDALTSEFKVNYVRPARGPSLVARAEAAAGGRRQAVCRCEIHAIEDGEERLCALAQGTVVAAGR